MPAAADESAGRSCGECSLCCTLLRVDELRKLGGTPCPELRDDGAGCGIYAQRPGICREYRCLWLSGGLREEDRPDRLGAILSFVPTGVGMRLSICEVEPGSFDRSPRLQEIAAEHRDSMPVRITHAQDVMNPERPFRVLLAGGEEQRVEGEHILVLHDGRPVAERRMPWLHRQARRLGIRWQRWRLRGLR